MEALYKQIELSWHRPRRWRRNDDKGHVRPIHATVDTIAVIAIFVAFYAVMVRFNYG